MRERQNFQKEVDNWDHDDAVTCSEFGLFWGANGNIHPMADWNVIEVFRNKRLLSRVRAELTTAEF